MALKDPLDNRQTDACAGKFLLPVQPLEGVKKLPGIFRIETRAIVAHVKHSFVPLVSGSKLYARTVVLARIFPGVANKILQHRT